jgi:isoprenylcysteine carboxyl methyltransferase (ICMT) family protein YpbQ
MIVDIAVAKWLMAFCIIPRAAELSSCIRHERKVYNHNYARNGMSRYSFSQTLNIWSSQIRCEALLNHVASAHFLQHGRSWAGRAMTKHTAEAKILVHSPEITALSDHNANKLTHLPVFLSNVAWLRKHRACSFGEENKNCISIAHEKCLCNFWFAIFCCIQRKLFFISSPTACCTLCSAITRDFVPHSNAMMDRRMLNFCHGNQFARRKTSLSLSRKRL